MFTVQTPAHSLKNDAHRKVVTLGEHVCEGLALKVKATLDADDLAGNLLRHNFVAVVVSNFEVGDTKLITSLVRVEREWVSIITYQFSRLVVDINTDVPNRSVERHVNIS